MPYGHRTCEDFLYVELQGRAERAGRGVASDLESSYGGTARLGFRVALGDRAG